MICHIKLEFDLDTETRRTTNVTPFVQLHEGAHVCRYPKCAKPIPLDLTFCNRTCFNAHGKRPRQPKVQAIAAPPPMAHIVEQIVKTPAPQAIIHLPMPCPAPDYRQFTFPQGGLS